MTHALVIENLTKRYKDFTLDKISFSLPQGTILGIIGENGSGKSTLINTMLGIIPSDYSRLDILGRELKTKPNEIKSDLAVIFDDAGYDEYFTPLQIGRFLSYVYPNWNMNMFRSYLHRFGLPAKKRLKTFSRGMRTKLEFAIAFSHDPKFLIMDEATNGLDPIFRDEILELLREFSEEENHTVLIASHITSDLDKIADYVAFLHQGKLLFFQPYDKLQNEYGILTCKNSFLCNLNPADVVFYRKEEYNCRVLPAKKRLKTFSSGMRTKLEFAIAFSHDPKFLIMDEATNGLDPIFRDEILELLREFSEEENHTVLIASHITSDLDKIADYVAFLHQGKLLFFQPYDKLQNEYGILTCKNSFLCNLNPADVVFYRKEEYNCRVLVKNRFALAKIFQDMEIIPATLEDLMLFYTKGEKLE